MQRWGWRPEPAPTGSLLHGASSQPSAAALCRKCSPPGGAAGHGVRDMAPGRPCAAHTAGGPSGDEGSLAWGPKRAGSHLHSVCCRCCRHCSVCLAGLSRLSLAKKSRPGLVLPLLPPPSSPLLLPCGPRGPPPQLLSGCQACPPPSCPRDLSKGQATQVTSKALPCPQDKSRPLPPAFVALALVPMSLSSMPWCLLILRP